MNKMQAQVREFKHALNGTDNLDVCYKLIEEEANELLNAMQGMHLIEVVDGMCDLIYVVFYLANALNIDLEPYFDEVQRTNMLKERGEGNHKIRKPEGWEAPRIGQMLRAGVGEL